MVDQLNVHISGELLIKLDYGEEDNDGKSDVDRELSCNEEHKQGCCGGGITVLPDGFKLSDYTPKKSGVCTCGQRTTLGDTDKEYLPSSQR